MGWQILNFRSQSSRVWGCQGELESDLTKGGADWSGDETQMTKGIWEGVMKVNKFVPWYHSSWLTLEGGSWPGQAGSVEPWVMLFPAASCGWGEPGPPPWECLLRQLVGEEQFHLNKTVVLTSFIPLLLGGRMLTFTHFWDVLRWLSFGDNNHLLW